ncbi:MAG TPA: phosphatidate cytidylyltransferase [Ignavibacteriales bacterium]|nr:phosphatidate cytidylyltransferase [Ignavibacteriales bacterium]
MNKNMLIRILVSIIAIPAILFIIYLGKLPFLFFVSVIAIISLNEFYSFIKQKNIQPQLIIGNMSAVIILFNTYYHFIDLRILLLGIVFILSLIELFRNKNSSIYNLGGSLIGIFYIVFFLSSLINIREFDSINYEKGGLLIISMIITIWSCDSAAYFGGISCGKHKLFPRVSPKKSWEGSIFGFVFSIIAMIILQKFVIDFITLQQAVIMGAIIGIFAQIGDLIESLFKRDAGVKDSSNLIPGHGGFFDRFDSLIFISPIIEIIIKLLNI